MRSPVFRYSRSADAAYLINALALAGRLQNARLGLESRYYVRRSPQRVFFAAAAPRAGS